MPGKKLLWLVLAVGSLSNAGCCAFWDRVCHEQHGYQPAPCCPVPPQCGCAPSYYQPPPGTVTPVPPVAPRTSWQGNCP